MACPEWGAATGEDEVRLLVGPAAVLGTILAAIGRGVRPEGMSVGSRGRRLPLIAAAVLAVATLVCLLPAIYANESCTHTTVIARSGPAEVTLLQMFWMLAPGVAAASIVSAMCTLAAAHMTLPRWTRQGWKVNHIPRLVQNGVISPQDDYGIGAGALRRYSLLWFLAYGTWALVTLAMLYTAARGDLTNGLLNLAGLLAVATNTGIPVWNMSQSGSGTDSKSKNVDLICTVETNVVGNFYDNIAAVTTAIRDKSDAKTGPNFVLGRTQNYVVANAHAMIADYRGEEMDAGRFAYFGKSPADLGQSVIAATLATTRKLSRVLAEADYGDDVVERMTLSAYMCTIAASSAWEKIPAQRRRLLALAMAIAWEMKITGALGGKIARTDGSLATAYRHSADACSCCLHRWTVWRPLQESPNAEMEFLFGRSGHLPQIIEIPERQAYAAEVWKHMKANVSTNVRNRGLLMYYWIMAMMDNALLQPYGSYDHFPQAAVKLEAFSAEDFKLGCSNSGQRAHSWKPSITSPGSYPQPSQMCNVDPDEMSSKSTRGRHRMYPHPKVLDHVARRTIYRGIMVQSVIWGLQFLRGIVSG